jgi:hypothetical protein
MFGGIRKASEHNQSIGIRYKVKHRLLIDDRAGVKTGEEALRRANE